MSEAKSHSEIQALLREEIDALKTMLDARFHEIAVLTQRLEQAEAEREAEVGQRMERQQRRHALELVLCDMRNARRQSDAPAPGVPGFARQLEALESSPLFDAAWYLETYADAREAGVNPPDHYLRAGAFEGRNPGPEFDTMAYYMANPDVAAAGWPALVHYVMFGQAEGRSRG